MKWSLCGYVTIMWLEMVKSPKLSQNRSIRVKIAEFLVRMTADFCKKQYSWYLELKLLFLVCFGNWRVRSHGPLPPPHCLRPWRRFMNAWKLITSAWNLGFFQRITTFPGICAVMLNNFHSCKGLSTTSWVPLLWLFDQSYLHKLICSTNVPSKQFRTDCVSVFDHFVGLTLKELREKYSAI